MLILPTPSTYICNGSFKTFRHLTVAVARELLVKRDLFFFQKKNAEGNFSIIYWWWDFNSLGNLSLSFYV